MDLYIKIKVSITPEKTKVTIEDDGTDWSVLQSITDVTSLGIRIFERNSNSVNYVYELDSLELSRFLDIGKFEMDFTNEKFFGGTYFDDGYFLVKFITNEDDTIPNGIAAFTVDRAIKKTVFSNTTRDGGFISSIEDLKRIAGSVIGLDMLDRLGASPDPDREIRWREIYDYVKNLVIE